MRWFVTWLLLATATGACAGEVTWKTTPFAEACREAETGNSDEGVDELFKTCKGLGSAAVWVLYQDSARMSVGFGKHPHVAVQGLSPERDAKWPVQWGGSSKGEFKPLVSIVRFKKLEESKSTLFVFRLLDNGNSCLVGEVAAGAGQSKKAQDIAAKAMKSWTCLVEPVPVTS